MVYARRGRGHMNGRWSNGRAVIDHGDLAVSHRRVAGKDESELPGIVPSVQTDLARAEAVLATA